ncbi:MAG TPA: TetR/AcrR family transcriptional regulator [Nitrolancea sp.]|nr:TetR/AcrR family transcriptional regulator [Nitrolancea sp.]
MATNAALSGRARVLHEAREFFLKFGYTDVSMQQIADAAGMTKAALYYHFRDKDDLFGQVIIEEMVRQRHSVEALIEKSSGPIAELVDRLAHHYLSELVPDIIRLMGDYQRHVPESRHDDVHRELETFITIFNRLFERAAKNGEIGDIPPRLAASIFFHTLLGVVHQSFDPDATTEPLDPDYAASIVTTVFLHGITTNIPRSPARNGIIAPDLASATIND